MGLAEARKQYALEQHTVEHITSIVGSNEWNDDVDLVNGGHIQMLVTDEEVEEAKADYDAAASAGLKLESVSWISKEEMFEVRWRALRTSVSFLKDRHTVLRCILPGLFDACA